MTYQYKKEPLNNDEVDKLTNACSTFREKFVIWTFLDTGWQDIINKRSQVFEKSLSSYKLKRVSNMSRSVFCS